MSSAQKSHKNKFILISNCESYVGHALAYHLATELMLRPGKMKKKWRVRALCENLQGNEDLVQAGVDVQVKITTFLLMYNIYIYIYIIPTNGKKKNAPSPRKEYLCIY